MRNVDVHNVYEKQDMANNGALCNPTQNHSPQRRFPFAHHSLRPAMKNSWTKTSEPALHKKRQTISLIDPFNLGITNHTWTEFCHLYFMLLLPFHLSFSSAYCVVHMFVVICDNDIDNDKQFIPFRHGCPYNINDMNTSMYIIIIVMVVNCDVISLMLIYIYDLPFSYKGFMQGLLNDIWIFYCKINYHN